MLTYSVEGDRVEVDTVVLPAYGIDPDDSVRWFLGLCTRLSEGDGVGAGGNIDGVEWFIVQRDADGSKRRGSMRTEVQSQRREILDVELEPRPSPMECPSDNELGQ